MTIDYKNLKGKDLFLYMTTMIEDKDYASIISLLPYATMDIDKCYSILEYAIKENKTFVTIYPGLGEIATKDMQLIGSIEDGELYLK